MTDHISDVPIGTPAYSFDAKCPPVIWVEPGSRLCFRTSDESYRALSGRAIDSGSVNFQRVNRLVGPVGLRGAAPGDALGVTIDSITTASRAFMVYPARWRSRTFGRSESEVVQVSVENGVARLPNGGQIAGKPMVGCIGVAPNTGIVSALSPTSPTGGNMDLVEICAGATIWFPIMVEGAMLSLGDVHLRMGRGEPVGAGLECAGDVEVTLDVAERVKLNGPLVIDQHHIHFVGTHPNDSGEAERIAVKAAWEWLSQDLDLDLATRLAICAALLELEFGGPAGANVVASFPRNELLKARVSGFLWPLESKPARS